MAFDLELNQPSNTIIQVGVCVGNLKSGEILYKYSENIYCDEPISEFITKLTKITQEDVQNGKGLFETYINICEAHRKYGCFRNPITWGGGDCTLLKEQLPSLIDEEGFLFGRRWIDAKTVFISKCFAEGASPKSGLAKSLTRLNLHFEGTKHTAVDDAVNTFRIYRELLTKF